RVTELTGHGGGFSDGCPTLSPDRTRIVFKRGIPQMAATDKIYIANYPSMTNAEQLVDINGNEGAEYWPDWRGNQIVFYHADNAIDQVYSINAQGSGVKRLSSRTVALDSYPKLSSDGRYIAFVQ